MRKKRSPIWSITRSELEQLVREADSFSKILKHFGLNNIGGNVRTLRQRLEEEGISTDHIKKGTGANKGRKFPSTGAPLDGIMVENSTYCRTHLKRRLLEEGVLENVCEECGQGPFWNGKPMSLVLDHKNGVRNDHRRDNLRILCPNCNTQTDNFCGRRKKYSPIV